jgi:hypothetical protein
MAKEKKAASKKEELPITDVLEERFKDEEGPKCRRIFMSGKKKIGEEVVND